MILLLTLQSAVIDGHDILVYNKVRSQACDTKAEVFPAETEKYRPASKVYPKLSYRSILK